MSTPTENTFQEEEVTEKPFDPRLMVRLLAYLRPYSKWVVVAFLLILLSSTVRQAGPFLSRIAVDDYILVGDFEGLKGIVVLYLGLLCFHLISSYFENWITKMTGQWAMRDVRNQIFAHLQRLPMAFFDRTPIGRLMTRNTNDVDALNELFTDGIVAVFSNVFTLIAILIYMFYMDFELSLIVCTVLPFMFGVTFWFQGRMLVTFRQARSRLARLNAYLQENISGIAVVQLYNREDPHERRFGEINQRYLDANLQSTLYHSIFFPIMQMLGSVATAMVIWVGAGEALRAQIDWGILVAMLQYIPRFFWPILDISERYMILQAAMASSERIFELLDTETEDAGGDHRLKTMQGKIEFENVWFAYSDEDWVLRDVSFKIEPGETLAIVGPTGSGKTTIISLLCRFYDIQRGTIRVDGVEIRQWDLHSLRSRIGVVQQDVFLFSGDIERNIRLGDEEITMERVEQAARDANADHFISQLPGEYAHSVAERGSTLSGGQRQLLAFARALAFAPDVLVLDEATSSVDTETETWIQEAVERIMESRTSIVIAHRISTIRNADRIMVLHKGRLRESGSHQELMAAGGIYYRLHQLQYLGDREL